MGSSIIWTVLSLGLELVTFADVCEDGREEAFSVGIRFGASIICISSSSLIIIGSRFMALAFPLRQDAHLQLRDASGLCLRASLKALMISTSSASGMGGT